MVFWFTKIAVLEARTSVSSRGVQQNEVESPPPAGTDPSLAKISPHRNPWKHVDHLTRGTSRIGGDSPSVSQRVQLELQQLLPGVAAHVFAARGFVDIRSTRHDLLEPRGRVDVRVCGDVNARLTRRVEQRPETSTSMLVKRSTSVGFRSMFLNTEC